ncbi:MAG: GNAT family N-acetyltransferase [Flavobacteriaceae bacterium]
MNAVNLRFAEEKDMKSVLALIQELADFEKEPDAVLVTEADLKRDAFGEQPKFQCIVAEKEESIIGMALFYPRYSTWKGPTLHLEDLIVTHTERGTGVGKALYTAFIDYAFSQKVKRIEWVVLDWNTHAVNFYKESGASVLTDWYTVQMDEVAMQQYLAKEK